MHITFVKKILANGEPCGKCAEVERRLIDSGQVARIDAVLVADERDSTSPGMVLANRFAVARAPFFVVYDGESDPRVYTVYFKFAKEVLGERASPAEEATETLIDNPDLDFI